jgi:hypothetical protein
MSSSLVVTMVNVLRVELYDEDDEEDDDAREKETAKGGDDSIDFICTVVVALFLSHFFASKRATREWCSTLVMTSNGVAEKGLMTLLQLLDENERKSQVRQVSEEEEDVLMSTITIDNTSSSCYRTTSGPVILMMTRFSQCRCRFF